MKFEAVWTRQVSSAFNNMENGFSLMPNYLQMVSFFATGETYNQQKSMVCVSFHAGTFRVHDKLLAKF